VTVTIRVGEEQLSVSRAADQPAQVTAAQRHAISVFSQNEIEWIGLDPEGRLKVIDGFWSDAADLRGRGQAIVAEIRSVCAELQEHSRESEELENRIASLEPAKEALVEAERQQSEILKTVSASINEQHRSEALGRELASLSVQREILERVDDSRNSWLRQVEAAAAARPVLDPWPSATTSEDPFVEVSRLLAESTSLLSEAAANIQRALSAVGTTQSDRHHHRSRLEDEARKLRQQLEAIKQGAGSAARRVSELRERVGQLEALTDRAARQAAAVASSRSRRDELLDQLDSVRDERFRARDSVAQMLYRRLGPQIKIEIERSGLFAEYTRSIEESLKGSGIHYKTLAPLLAERLSPRELAAAVDTGDAATLCSIASIGADRANRAIAHLRSLGVESILTSHLNDDVRMLLLDGPDYKPTEDLSTGQRCTVLLPVLLRAYPKTPADRRVIQAQARCKKAS